MYNVVRFIRTLTLFKSSLESGLLADYELCGFFHKHMQETENE